MPTPIHDNSEAQFRRVLVVSLAVYFTFSILTIVIPYKPDRQNISIRPHRIVKLTEIPLKGPSPAAIPPAKIRDKRRRLDEHSRREESPRIARSVWTSEKDKKKLE